MEASKENILFAARRYLNAEMKSTIILVNVRTGQRFPIPEDMLKKDQDCNLGEYLSYTDSRLTKKVYLPSTVDRDVAYVNDIQSKLVNVDGTLLFRNEYFADSLCTTPLPPGDYVIRVSLRLKEHKLPSGAPIHFDASNVRTLREQFQTRSLFSPISPPRSPLPNPPITPSSSTPPGKGPIVIGNGFQAKPKPSQNNPPKPNNNKVFGAGFWVKEAPKQEKKVMVGAGFAPPEKKKEEAIVGAGFKQVTQKKQKLRAVVPPATPSSSTPPGKGADFPTHLKSNNNGGEFFGTRFRDEEIIPDAFTLPGEGIIAKEADFPAKDQNIEPGTQEKEKLRAVVLSITENPKTNQNTHFLWILEKQAEGRFVSKERKLLPGHFFSGTYVENKLGKWNCEQYENPIEKPAGIDGGMDSDNIWFAVTISDFQLAGANKKFGSAKAKYFGEVVEGELETCKLSAELNMKKVKIQRKGIAQGDYVWMVVDLV